ncbi:hypothetical protein NL355_29825, partial [Klebsiella pneumoniae]|nr:hypothetical protein [Klebsiella pneumoniae]
TKDFVYRYYRAGKEAQEEVSAVSQRKRWTTFVVPLNRESQNRVYFMGAHSIVESHVSRQ